MLKQKLIIYLHEVEGIEHKYIDKQTVEQLVRLLHAFHGRIYQVNEYFKGN